MERLTIAVCEDDAGDLAALMGLLEAYDTEHLLDIRAVDRAEALLESGGERSDIVLLDIQMPGTDGFETAKLLRQRADPPVVIFVTGRRDCASKGYGLALRYLTKPPEKSELFEALDAAVEERVSGRIAFEVNEATWSLPLGAVYYIEVVGHYAMVCTETEEYRVRSSLKELAAKLPRGTFAAPHKSYLVNMAHIRSATAGELLLDNGTRIPVSRRRAAEFTEALYRYLGR